MERARAEARTLAASAAEEARRDAAAKLAAHTLALAAREATLDESALDRTLSLARLLAERLLGEALTLEPSRVAALAQTALAEARGARSVVIVAHPDDALVLERALEQGGLERVTRVVASPTRARGALRLESDIGVLDADLAPQLDRLTARLRESLT